MSLTKGVLIGAGALIGGGLLFSLAMIPLGRPTLWELPAAPEIVNTEHLVRAESQPDYTWTVHRNEEETGLLPCGPNLDTEDSQTSSFCSKDSSMELDRVSDSAMELRVNSTYYRYSCSPGSSLKDALLDCRFDPMRSLFG